MGPFRQTALSQDSAMYVCHASTPSWFTVSEYSIETLKFAKWLWLSIDFEIALNRSWTNHRTNVQNCRCDEGTYRRSRIRKCRRESIQNSHRRLARWSQATRIRAVGVIRFRYWPWREFAGYFYKSVECECDMKLDLQAPWNLKYGN